MSPRRSQSRSVSCDSTAVPHEWTPFEIRTLICLIIKREHEFSPEPIDFATKLNKALNPRRAARETAEEHFNRDIPVQDVQEMLQRILSKKRHAVEVSDRHPTAVVTKAKMQAFVRSLDFDGGEDEWEWTGRKERVMAERSKMRARLEAEAGGGGLSPGHQDDKSRRRAIIEDDPNAQRLLAAWGMGASFWEGPPRGDASQRAQGQVYPDPWTPGFEDDFSAGGLGNDSSAATSITPAAEEDGYPAGPDTPRGPRDRTPARTPLDTRTPDWSAPPAPEAHSVGGGWVGGFTPAPQTPLPSGDGETSGQGVDPGQPRYNNTTTTTHDMSKWCGY